ncbi:MAG: efflux RND transporter periplasmic adaptor subunit [Bacteroidales bacterium]
MKRNIFSLGATTLLLLLLSCGGNKAEQQQQQAEPQSYKTEVLKPQQIELSTAFPAVLKGQEDIDIKPRVDGFIERVYVDEGSEVRKGQALFSINSPSSVKSYEEAQANYNTAKLDVERIRPLAKKEIISEVQLKSYENTLVSAEAALNQAKASLSWATVTSPVDGVVGTISFRQGSLVNSTSILTTVANTTNIFATFSMNEKELYNFLDEWEGNTKAEKIKNMPEITFLLSNGTKYDEPGRIATISGMVDQTAGTVNIRASLPNKNGLLLSGTSGQVVIPEHIHNALIVPQKATFSRQDKTVIYKVEGDTVVQKVINVKTSPDGQNYVVVDGLSEGDRIVIDDIISLSNGAKIKVQ